jgi:hypothetical protein
MSRVFRYIMLQILTKITLINIFVNNLINSEDIVKIRKRNISIYLISIAHFGAFLSDL